MALDFASFAGFFTICKNKFLQNKVTANFFLANIYSTVEIIFKKCWFDLENAIDNSVDNTSSGTLVIVDPL